MSDKDYCDLCRTQRHLEDWTDDWYEMVMKGMDPVDAVLCPDCHREVMNAMRRISSEHSRYVFQSQR